ncbi:probable DNA-directed RNA polymerase I subunit RPA43 [Hyalella azteca]|uniref:Probable DNA-directed RNA polymerase I subunit RPA43 n=1 Tax=Hyalella azteca TaxID=294128 RepID=A0A8B7PPS1_HYAAZ|nr:probable DNA-directed RNA polymerase I subunit RPA43 [Hyalella azteca]
MLYHQLLDPELREFKISLEYHYSTFRLGGLILGYEDVKVFSGSGQLYSTNPYVHLSISAVFYVFAPTKGLLIEGVVNKVTPHMVSFLAYNKYNIIYRIHQVKQELQLQRSCMKKSEAYQSLKSVLKHLQDLSLIEGTRCTLLLQEVGLRDFLPQLLGHPVPDGFDVSILDASNLQPLSDANKKRVRFHEDGDFSSGATDSDCLTSHEEGYSSGDLCSQLSDSSVSRSFSKSHKKERQKQDSPNKDVSTPVPFLKNMKQENPSPDISCELNASQDSMTPSETRTKKKRKRGHEANGDAVDFKELTETKIERSDDDKDQKSLINESDLMDSNGKKSKKRKRRD